MVIAKSYAIKLGRLAYKLLTKTAHLPVWLLLSLLIVSGGAAIWAKNYLQRPKIEIVHGAIKLPPQAKLSKPDIIQITEIQDSVKTDTVYIEVPVNIEAEYAALPVTSRGVPFADRYKGGIRIPYFYEGSFRQATYGLDPNRIRPALGVYGGYHMPIFATVGAEAKVGLVSSTLAVGYNKDIFILLKNDISWKRIRASLTISYWKDLSGTLRASIVF